MRHEIVHSALTTHTLYISGLHDVRGSGAFIILVDNHVQTTADQTQLGDRASLYLG